VVTPGILAQDDIQQRLDVNDLDAGIVVGELINPSGPGLTQDTGRIQGEGSAQT
jgi:hypothetical protein